MSSDFDEARHRFGPIVQSWRLEQVAEELQQSRYAARAEGRAVALGLLAAVLESGRRDVYGWGPSLASLLTQRFPDLIESAPLHPLLSVAEKLGLEQLLQHADTWRRLLVRVVSESYTGASHLPLVAPLALSQGSTSLQYLGGLLAQQRGEVGPLGAVIALLEEGCRVWVLEGLSHGFQPESVREAEDWLRLFPDAVLDRVSAAAAFRLLQGACRADTASPWSESDYAFLGRLSRRLLPRLR
jgi:hypothetical protein